MESSASRLTHTRIPAASRRMTSSTFLSVLSRTRSLKLLYEFLLRNSHCLSLSLSLSLYLYLYLSRDEYYAIRILECTAVRSTVPTNKENRPTILRPLLLRHIYSSISSRIPTISTNFYVIIFIISRDVLSCIFLIARAQHSDVSGHLFRRNV